VAGKLSRLQKVYKWALAQCRGTNLQRSRKFIKVQNFNCEQLRESGFITYYKFVLVAGTYAKTVTSLCTLLSVLCGAVFDHADIISLSRTKISSPLSHCYIKVRI